MDDEVVIKVERLSKKYKLGQSKKGDLRSTFNSLIFKRKKQNSSTDFWALRDISFEVKKGEVLGVIGANGAGKSTLLKILSRITYPSSGRIEIIGRVASLLEIGTGFHPELSGRENIFLNGSLLGMRRQEIKDKFSDIVAFSEINQFIDTPVKHYSSGMYVRLAFAVAAHLEPEILIVDEVLAVGDIAFQKKCLGKMSEVARGGKTVIFVSHNLDAIRQLCTSSIVLQNGEITHQGESSLMINFFLDTMFPTTLAKSTSSINRPGNGAVRIESIHIEDKERNHINTLFAGQWLKIILNYKSPFPLIQSLIVRLEIVDSSNQILFICNNLLSDGEFFNLSDSGQVSCVINKLPLNKGNYFIHIYAQVNRKDSDIFINAYELNVQGGNFYSTGKLPLSHKGLLVEYHWQT